jgi:hypothetical protein
MNKKLEYLKKVSKVNKVELGAIDDIHDKLDNINWSDGLSETYDLFDKATAFGATLINTTEAQLDEIERNLDFLESALEELGIDSETHTAEAREDYERIRIQIEGLKDDMNSGVLSGASF